MSPLPLSDGTLAEWPSPDQTSAWADSYAAWAENVTQEHAHGDRMSVTTSDSIRWTAPNRPLSEAKVALVTSGGVHLRSQPPFDVFADEGDWSFREIPGDVDGSDLQVSHTHYATEDAERDINVMFPIDRLRDLELDGVVGSVSDLHFGFMGFIPNPAYLVSDTAPTMARALRDHGVEIVVLTGG